MFVCRSVCLSVSEQSHTAIEWTDANVYLSVVCLSVRKHRLYHSNIQVSQATSHSCAYDVGASFLNKLEHNENTLRKMFQNNIQVELSELSALYCT